MASASKSSALADAVSTVLLASASVAEAGSASGAISAVLVAAASTIDAGGATDLADTQANAMVGDTPEALSPADFAGDLASDLAAIVERRRQSRR